MKYFHLKYYLILVLRMDHFICNSQFMQSGYNSNFYSNGTSTNSHNHNRVILISLDGLRWDLWRQQNAPNLRRIATEGVSVRYVRNVFPTNTMPNHYSIVTGLYPENHGIIENWIYDPKTKSTFSIMSEDSKWWNQAEPIWVTNQKQGGKSGVCFYPGYDMKIRGSYPSYTTKDSGYDKPFLTTPNMEIMPFTKRVSTVVEWMKADPNLTFAALYSEEPDWTEHETQPDPNNRKDRQKLREAMSKVDSMVGYLESKLAENGMEHNTNIIIVGDHGHVNVLHKKIINLGDYLDIKENIEYATGKSTVFIYPKSGRTYRVYKSLKHSHPHMNVYLKKGIPEKFHIKRNDRTPPILILPEPGWLVNNTIRDFQGFDGKFEKGEHGYSNYARSMNPAFLAKGPAFKKGFELDVIEIVDIYSLMCHIIGIKPLTNDGKFDRVKKFLATTDNETFK